MKKFTLLFAFICVLTFSFAALAQSPHLLDFESAINGAGWTWNMAGNGSGPAVEFVANPVSGGINTSATVAKFTASQSGESWALCWTDGNGKFTFDATNSTVKIMVYKSIISDFGFKVEGSTGTVTELKVANTLVDQWEELTFDFSSLQGQSYSRLTIIPDFAARSQDNIVYFDNIQAPNGVLLVDVTLQFNASTVLDTLGVNGFVEVRGALNNWSTGAVLPGGKTINWDTSSDLDMVNAGGDYWTVTFEMDQEDTLRYKFWTGHNSTTGTQPGGGWEGPFDNTIADTRILITGMNDTLVPVQFYNPDLGLGPQPQYKKPYEIKADSIAVYFRVNMAGEMEAGQFDPDTEGPIGVRGDPTNSAGIIDWGSTKVLLTREASSVYNGSFWSGVAYFPKSGVTVGVTQLFKWYAEGTANLSWEAGDNRTFKYPVAGDTTVQWTWFSNKKPTGVVPIESIVTWRVSTEALEAIGMFDRGVGDKIEVRGPRGQWAADEVQLFYNPLLEEWTSANEAFKLPPGTEIFFKYYVRWDASRGDSNSPNYLPNVLLDSYGWEEPAITGGGNRTHVYEDAAEQTVVGDFGFDRQFFNSVPGNGVIDHDVTVSWSVDMTNATVSDSNHLGDLFRPGVDSVKVQWDGELTAVTQGQPMWDAAARFLTLEDPNGDMIYTGSYTIKVSEKFPNIWYQLGYKVVYKTASGSWVTPGSGIKLGRRFMQYIHPTKIVAGDPWPVPTWPTTYDLPQVRWREDDLFVEIPPPDLTTPDAIDAKDGKLSITYSLGQNYPNPFNPTTTINYSLANGGNVSIKVYSITGQLVATLINAFQPQGNHFVKWNGKNLTGQNVSSGVYFVEMISGDFSKVNKMMLMR